MANGDSVDTGGTGLATAGVGFEVPGTAIVEAVDGASQVIELTFVDGIGGRRAGSHAGKLAGYACARGFIGTATGIPQ
ncbi:hypothetical protein D3C76_1226360 [compost metagenome]